MERDCSTDIAEGATTTEDVVEINKIIFACPISVLGELKSQQAHQLLPEPSVLKVRLGCLLLSGATQCGHVWD